MPAREDVNKDINSYFRPVPDLDNIDWNVNNIKTPNNPTRQEQINEEENRSMIQ